VIKTTGLILAFVLGLGATRDIVCQLACAEPDAAHRTAACHESGNMGGALLQAVQDHCVAIEGSPATAPMKVSALSDRGVVMSARVHSSSPPPTLTPPARCELPPGACCSSRAFSSSVLRI